MKPDIVMLLNGIPIVPINAKKRVRQGMNYLEGVCLFFTFARKAQQNY
jgi:type I restriction enzyme R subunit